MRVNKPVYSRLFGDYLPFSIAGLTRFSYSVFQYRLCLLTSSSANENGTMQSISLRIASFLLGPISCLWWQGQSNQKMRSERMMELLKKLSLANLPAEQRSEEPSPNTWLHNGHKK